MGLVSLFAGYNFQLGQRYILGGQFEGSIGSLPFRASGTEAGTRDRVSLPSGQSILNYPFFQRRVVATTVNWMATILGRGGLIVGENTLIYGLGGFGLAVHNYFNTGVPSQGKPVSIGKAWVAGVGIEQKISSNWSWRAEYRRVQFFPISVNSYNSSEPFYPSDLTRYHETVSSRTTMRHSADLFRIGLAYSLN